VQNPSPPPPVLERADSLLPISNSGNSLANLWGQLFLDTARPHLGDVMNHDRRRGGEGYDEPDQTRESKSCERNEFEQMGIGWIEVAYRPEGDQEDYRRDAGDNDQSDVDGAMQALARAAMWAFDKVLLIIAAHLCGNAGDVVSPTRKDVAYHLIDAL